MVILFVELTGGVLFSLVELAFSIAFLIASCERLACFNGVLFTSVETLFCVVLIEDRPACRTVVDSPWKSALLFLRK